MFRTSTHLSTAGPAAEITKWQAQTDAANDRLIMRGAAAGDHSAMTAMQASDAPTHFQAAQC